MHAALAGITDWYDIGYDITAELLAVNPVQRPKGISLRTAAAGKASQVEEKLPSPAQYSDMREIFSNDAAINVAHVIL